MTFHSEKECISAPSRNDGDPRPTNGGSVDQGDPPTKKNSQFPQIVEAFGLNYPKNCSFFLFFSYKEAHEFD